MGIEMESICTALYALAFRRWPLVFGHMEMYECLVRNALQQEIYLLQISNGAIYDLLSFADTKESFCNKCDFHVPFIGSIR